MQSLMRLTGRKFETWINSFSPFGARMRRSSLFSRRAYSFALMKFGITSTAQLPKVRQVSPARYREIAVNASDCAIENRVIGRKLLRDPTSVMSVPCRVVTNGRYRLDLYISRAKNPAVACGIA